MRLTGDIDPYPIGLSVPCALMLSRSLSQKARHSSLTTCSLQAGVNYRIKGHKGLYPWN